MSDMIEWTSATGHDSSPIGKTTMPKDLKEAEQYIRDTWQNGYIVKIKTSKTFFRLFIDIEFINDDGLLEYAAWCRYKEEGE